MGADPAGEAILALLARGDEARLRARGQSMRPLLPDGTRLLLRSLSPGEPLHLGDVVLTRPGGLVLHRVVALRSTDEGLWVVTRGDGRRTADPPLPRSAVLARVVEATLFGRPVRLDGLLGRAVGLFAVRLLPHLWFLRK